MGTGIRSLLWSHLHHNGHFYHWVSLACRQDASGGATMSYFGLEDEDTDNRLEDADEDDGEGEQSDWWQGEGDWWGD